MVYIAGTHLAVYFAESKSAFSLMSRKTFPRPCMKLWDLSVADACIYRNGHVLTSGSSMEDPGQESPQEEAADEDQGFSIQDVIAVNGPGRRKTWYPQTKHVHGNLFFCLNQWDRGCTLFFTMKGLELRAVKAPHTMSAKFVNLCKRQRQDICDEALHQHLLAAARSAGDKEEDVKRRTAVEEDKYIVGESIVLQMPQVERNGVHVGPTDMKCLWGVKNKDLWLELTNESLEYLSVALIHGDDDDDHDDEEGGDDAARSPKRKRKKRRVCPRSPQKHRKVARLQEQHADRTADAEQDSKDG